MHIRSQATINNTFNHYLLCECIWVKMTQKGTTETINWTSIHYDLIQTWKF